MTLNGRTYDFLKALAQLYFPALGTLYFALSGVWNLPDGQAVVGTVIAVDAFLGGVLKLSSANYTPPVDGKIVIDDSHPAKTVYQIDIQKHPQNIIDSGQKQVTLQVTHPETSHGQEG
jgi:hypothetical protein